MNTSSTAGRLHGTLSVWKYGGTKPPQIKSSVQLSRRRSWNIIRQPILRILQNGRNSAPGIPHIPYLNSLNQLIYVGTQISSYDQRGDKVIRQPAHRVELCSVNLTCLRINNQRGNQRLMHLSDGIPTASSVRLSRRTSTVDGREGLRRPGSQLPRSQILEYASFTQTKSAWRLMPR